MEHDQAGPPTRWDSKERPDVRGVGSISYSIPRCEQQRFHSAQSVRHHHIFDVSHGCPAREIRSTTRSSSANGKLPSFFLGLDTELEDEKTGYMKR